MLVYGLSKDAEKAQKSFQTKFSLPFPLIADPDQKLIKALGVIKDKVMYGKKVKGVARTTLLVNEGKVEKLWTDVKVDGHAAEVLAALGG